MLRKKFEKKSKRTARMLMRGDTSISQSVKDYRVRQCSQNEFKFRHTKLTWIIKERTLWTHFLVDEIRKNSLRSNLIQLITVILYKVIGYIVRSFVSYA